MSVLLVSLGAGLIETPSPRCCRSNETKYLSSLVGCMAVMWGYPAPIQRLGVRALSPAHQVVRGGGKPSLGPWVTYM